MKRLILVVLAVAILIFHQEIFRWCFTTYNRWTQKAPPPPPPQARKFTVAASFPAAASLARAVGGGQVEVVSPLPLQADPTIWVPAPADMRAFAGADLVVLGGAGLERWAVLSPPPPDKTLRLADAAKAQWIETPAGTDPHLFLDPALAAEEAAALAAELAKRDPAHAGDYGKNAADLRRRLETLEAQFKALPAGTVFSAAGRHAYLARACGWRVVSFDLKPALAPTEAQLESIRAAVKAHPEARAMLWDEAPAAETGPLMAKLGLVDVVFDPMLRDRDAVNPKDLETVMKENLERLRDTTR